MAARQVVACEDRTFVVTQNTNELLAWGGNEKGQLGHGHY
jgi:alpha-tubulin suppressor-like RCC1 family protein